MIYLTRQPSTSQGTFGTMLDDTGKQLSLTVERPADDPDHPCIPTGVYQVQPYQSPTKGNVWMIMNVPGRSEIEIHPANVYSQLLGCVGVGDSMGELFGLPAVMNSQSTFKMLKSTLPNSFELTVAYAIQS